MAKRASVFIGLCLLVLPLSLVAVIYWLLFLRNNKSNGEDNPSVGVVTKAEQPTTVEFPIPSKAVGRVIGRKGSNVRQVEESTSTRIRFKDSAQGTDGKIVVIAGRHEAVTRARAAVEAAVEAQMKPSGSNAVSLSIPSSAVGKIIGRQGSNIRNLQRETGAQIEIDSGRAGDERTCTITGTEEQVQKAQELLKEVISRASVQDGKSEAVLVPLEAVGRLIGRQGSNIQRAQQQTGAVITFDRNFSDDGFGRFIVRGTDDQMEAAKCLLLGTRVGSQSSITPKQDIVVAQSHLKSLVIGKLPDTGGEYFSVFVSAVEPDGDIWLQEAGPNSKELDALVEAMTSSYDSLPLAEERLSKIAIGSVCAAPFHTDGSWYRGVVESLDTVNSSAVVRYADFGDTGTVALGTLKALRYDLCVCAPL